MPVEQYLQGIIVPLLTKPEKAKIALTSDEMGMLLSVTVSSEDMGPVIGKAGETAKAIRHLVRIFGVKNNARVSVKINEPDGSVYRPRKREGDAGLLDSK